MLCIIRASVHIRTVIDILVARAPCREITFGAVDLTSERFRCRALRAQWCERWGKSGDFESASKNKTFLRQRENRRKGKTM